MSILDRLTRQTRLAPANKMLPPPPEHKADPVTPMPETPEPLIKLVQLCAACGKQEAVHPVKVGYWYIGLRHVGLCEACYAVAQEKEAQHHLSQKKTAVGLPVVQKGQV